jgi:hypothetical protein
MIELNFALLNWNHKDKRGFIYRKGFLNRLAPLFFAPRVERLIELQGFNLRGCQLSIPLGPGNLDLLDRETRRDMVARAGFLLADYGLQQAAVPRKLRSSLPQIWESLVPVVFGEDFIKALAVTAVAWNFSRHDLKKIIVVGEVEHFATFISNLAGYGIPVSLQSCQPTRYELLAHRLLYTEGYAVSTSYLNPAEWEEGELALVFDRGRAWIQAPRSGCLYLDNQSQGLFPFLEEQLAQNGIDANLGSLAPLLEASLLHDFAGEREQQTYLSEDAPESFLWLQQRAEEVGLWELFLDKG